MTYYYGLNILSGTLLKLPQARKYVTGEKICVSRRNIYNPSNEKLDLKYTNFGWEVITADKFKCSASHKN